MQIQLTRPSPPGDRERVKRVITEIIRQSPGDELTGKTKLFKAFYLAHLYFASDTSRYLTEWPIVKMPNGPGIDSFDAVIGELAKDRWIETGSKRVGPYQATVYRAASRSAETELSEDAICAIRKAMEFVSNKTGAQLSDLTHEHSRSWNNAELGEELNIYVDLLSEDDYKAETARASRIEEELATAWDT